MLRELRPGQQFTATELNDLARQVEMSTRASGAGELAVNNVGNSLVFRDVSIETVLARITGAGTGAKYPWIEVVRNADGTTTDITEFPGRFGSATTQPAIELGGRTDVPTGAVAELTILPDGVGWGFSYAAIAAPEDINGGITATSLETSASAGASFPSGYSALSTLSGTGLPSVSETVRVSLPTVLPFGALVAVWVNCRANLYVGTVSGATYGFFVVTAAITNGSGTQCDVLTIPYPGQSGAGDEPAYGSSTAYLPWVITGTAGNDYVDITLTYVVTFYSNVAWGGVSAPAMRLRVCTGAIGLVNPELVHSAFTGDWIDLPFGTRTCPAVATI